MALLRTRSSVDRASASGAEGRAFESRRVRHYCVRPMENVLNSPVAGSHTAWTRST